MKKKNANKSRKSFSVFAPYIALIVLLVTVGYSAFQSTGIISDMTAKVRPEFNIRVTNVEVENTSDAIVIDKDYSSTAINNVYTGKVFSNVTFTKTTSSVTYKVEITNFGNTEMGVASITGLPNNLTYELDTNTYDIGEKICDDANPNKCTLGAKKYIYVTIKYKNGSGTNTSATLNADFDLNFKELHNVYYNNTAIAYVIDGGNKTVSLGANSPTYVKVSGTLTNSSYTAPNVTLTGVTSDITIEEIHKIYVGNVEQQVVAVHGGNVTIDLGQSAPPSVSNITISGTYNSSTYNSPNLTINGVNTDIYITITGSQGGKLATTILNLIEGETPDANGIYTPESGTGCTNKLIDDGTADHNIRYVGANPCNYVTFNGQTWRIIGVFNNIGTEPLVKLVNSTAAYSTSVKYNNNNKNGSNRWGVNTLYKSMSSDSAATNSMVESVPWRTNGPNNATNPVATFYTSEKNTTSSNYSIGLISASDFGYATDNISACRNSNLGNWNVANCVTNHNWLDLDSGSNSFTVSAPGNANTVFRIQATHVIYTQTINTNAIARASVFLKADVLYDSGDGSSGTPYTLKMN